MQDILTKNNFYSSLQDIAATNHQFSTWILENQNQIHISEHSTSTTAADHL